MVNTVFEPGQDQIMNLVRQYQNDKNIQAFTQQMCKIRDLHTKPYAIIKDGLIIHWGFKWISEAGEAAFEEVKKEMNTYIQSHYSLILNLAQNGK